MEYQKRAWIPVLLALSFLFSGCTGAVRPVADGNVEQFNHEERISFEFLKENYTGIDLTDHSEFADLTLIDADLEGKEIFLTGELHGVKANEELHIKFLRYFKERTDFTYYLLEGGYKWFPLHK